MTKLFARKIQDMSTLQTANGKAKQSDCCHMKHAEDVDGAEKVGAIKFRSQHQDNNDLVKINQLIDLSDTPIRLTRDEICWSRVRTSASNCVCCCCNNTITLVTTDESYVLDHIPLDNIKTGQANSGLQYLALANDDQLAVIDLIESNACNPTTTTISKSATHDQHLLKRELRSKRRLVDLASVGLSMRDILFWRWIDETTLALVSSETLYTCQVDRMHIHHPALTALSKTPTQFLSLQRVCRVHPDLTGGSREITDVHRDASTNLYAISAHCQQQQQQQPVAHTKLTAPFRYAQKHTLGWHNGKSHQANSNNNNNNTLSPPGSLSLTLRPNSNSVPGRLSMLANANDEQHTPTGSIKSENFFSIESLRRATKLSQFNSFTKSLHSSQASIVDHQNDCEDIRGYTQIYCKMRDRSQLIQAHAVAFTNTTTGQHQTTSRSPGADGELNIDQRLPSNESFVSWTTLVAANLIGDKLKVYFIGMATSEDLSTSGQNSSPSIEFNSHHDGKMDYPTAIVCAKLNPNDDKTHAAMIVTKFGHLIVCSIARGSILFNVQVANDIICGAVLEDKSRGVMVICRNGQVLLVRIQEEKFRRLLDETKTYRRSAPSYCVPDSIVDDIDSETNSTNGLVDACRSTSTGQQQQQQGVSIETESTMDIEVIISTKL